MIDDRAVSSALSYALVVVITVTLTTGLVLGTESLVENQRQQAAAQELSVVGQQLSSTIETVDRFAGTEAEPETANVTRRFPARVAGSQYRIRVVSLDRGATGHGIRLDARDFQTDLTVPVRNTSTDLRTGAPVNGGSLRVAYVPSEGHLEVQHA